MVWAGRLRRAAGVGLLVWILALGSGSLTGRAEQLVGLAPAVIVPLGLSLVAPRPGETASFYAVAAALVALCGPGALLSMAVPVGSVGASGLAALWLVATLAVGAAGVERVVRRGLRPASELAVSAALLYLPVGGVWLVSSRAGHALLGFREPIVTLTAAHFHYAGFAAPLVVGLLGRRDEVASLAGLYRVTLPVVVLGIPLVAAGIQFGRALELPAAVVLALGMLGLAAILVRVGAGRLLGSAGGAARLGGALLAVAGVSLVFSMMLALLFAATGSATRGAGEPMIPYAEMASLHGAANALGFALCGLLGLALLPAAPLPPVEGPRP